jgi:hypothetical protein
MVCKASSFDRAVLSKWSVCQMIKRQEQLYNKRSVRHFSLLPRLLREVQSWLQESKCDKTCTAGFLPLIPQRIITSPATLTMREQPPGSFRVVCLKSGDQRPRCCGFMANVCLRPPLQLSASQTCFLVAGSGKSVLWLVAFLWLSKCQL